MSLAQDINKEKVIMYEAIRKALKEFTDKTGIIVKSINFDGAIVNSVDGTKRYAEYYDFSSEISTVTP